MRSAEVNVLELIGTIVLAVVLLLTLIGVTAKAFRPREAFRDSGG